MPVAIEHPCPGKGLVRECPVKRTKLGVLDDPKAFLGLTKSGGGIAEHRVHPGQKPRRSGPLEITADVSPVKTGRVRHLQEHALALGVPILKLHQRPGMVEAAGREASMRRVIEFEVEGRER